MEIDTESRKNIIKTLSKVLDEKLAKQVEESIFNFIKVYIESSDVPSFLAQSMYEDKSNNIINEITDKDSNYILDAIKKNKIKGGISNIAFLKPEELNPDRYKKIIDRYEEKENVTGKSIHPVFVISFYYIVSFALLLLAGMFKNGDGVFK